MPDALQPFAGKREFKEAFDARTDADVAREHTRLEATFAREMREAGAKHRRSTGNAPRVGLSPRGVEHAMRLTFSRGSMDWTRTTHVTCWRRS